MARTLEGKVALVTGGSRGIGGAIAKRLAADGAAVAITYVGALARAEEAVGAIQAAGGRALAIRADSADATAVSDAVTETVRTLGRLDVLVNNAGLAVVAPLEQFSLEDFDRMVAVNIRGVFAATQAASRHMGTGGRIITIGSVKAERMAFAGGAVYAMTKAAVARLTRGLARDLGPRGITVNTVQPGATVTDMNPGTGAFAEAVKGLTALGRYADPAEIAGLVAYLAGPDAAFVTGASVTIDGGYAA
jgi:3-oxoacyl-[acyl-carrier protein] reductase